MTRRYETVTHSSGHIETRWIEDNPVAVPKRKVTTDDFIDRIPRAAFEAIANHSSNEAKTFMAALSARSMINLDNDKTVYYVDRMLAAGIITQQEHDDILM